MITGNFIETVFSVSSRILLYEDSDCQLSKKHNKSAGSVSRSAAGGYDEAARQRRGSLNALYWQVALSAYYHQSGLLQIFGKEKFAFQTNNLMIVGLLIFLLVRGGDQDAGKAPQLISR